MQEEEANNEKCFETKIFRATGKDKNSYSGLSSLVGRLLFSSWGCLVISSPLELFITNVTVKAITVAKQYVKSSLSPSGTNYDN